jgi:hypothetical protein
VASGTVFIGHRAGYANANNWNTGVGAGYPGIYTAALEGNTTGTANAAMGVGALGANTTGSYNTAHGALALNSNTTASNNTAVGYQAGYSNTTSASNTFVGYQVGYGATGGLNVAVGSNVPGFYNSSLYSTTGSGNTALGAGAGAGITSGSTNIAIGHNAMASGSVTGSTNIAIGWGAGIALTSGSSNTFVGSGRAGFANGAGSAMTTGSANTILGTFSGNQGGLDIRTSSNYIVLSDGDGNPRGIFDNNGNFIIGTTTAGAGLGWATRLSVEGQFGAVIKSSGGAAYEALSTWNPATSGTRYQVYFRDGAGYGARGSITTDGTNTAFNTSSDYRLKDNPQPLTGSGAFIDALKPKTWVWKETGVQGVGFIAHEVQEVSPGSVVGEKDGEKMQQMEYGSAEFIANIIAELQSLRARVAQLETK